MSFLSTHKDVLRTISILILVAMLALSASMALVERLVTGDTSGDGDPVEVASIPLDHGFWARGGDHDVIVVFEDPCVVERRTALAARGVTDPGTLAVMSREHESQVEGRHAEFRAALMARFPGVNFNQEFTTVLNGIALTAGSEALDWISRRAEVAWIEPDTPVEVSLSNSVPLINADDLWKVTNGTGSNITGKGVVVAVLDTGLDYSHPDLGGTWNRASDRNRIAAGTHPRVVGGWNIVSNTSDFWDDDTYAGAHGTHCAGIVGANGTLTGVAPECEFLIYKVLNNQGSGYSSWVVKGVEMATDPDGDGDTSDHADVISMSLSGGGHPDDGKSKAVDNAVDAGAVVAVAASNKGRYGYETTRSPSEARKAISVGATDNSDNLASFSSRGPSATLEIKPDVVAPGVRINSTVRGGYGYKSGTSMATPHVAGAAALLIQSHPNWTSPQVKQALMGTAKDVGYDAYQQGAGRIDALKANETVVLADPPSVSLGRLSALTNVTNFTVTFSNLASGWTNGTLSWSLKWALTPLYRASGDNSDLSGMVTANATTLNISKGGSATVKLSVAFDSTSHVGHHLGELKLTTTTGKVVRVPLAFYVRSPILLVDDDNTDFPTAITPTAPWNNQNWRRNVWFEHLNSSGLIGDAMTALGITFDVMPVRGPAYLYSGDGPDRTWLAHYRAVIWNTGFDYFSYGDALTAKDLDELKAYVDGGGNLWLSGSLILYDLYGAQNKTSLAASDDMRAIFGLGGYRRHSGTPDPLGGAASTFLAGKSYDVDTASWGNVDYGANLTPTDGAYQLLSGSDTDYWGASWSNISSAIARDSGSNKTLLTAFEFGHVASASDRKDLVDRVLKWIDLRPQGVMAVSGDLKEGEAITFNGSVRNPRATESYTFEWDFDHVGTTFGKDATGASVSHAYADDGTFTVALRVLETRTSTYSPVVTRTVDVVNQAPEAHINTSSPGDEASPMHFWGNATDPGGNDTFTWEWDFEYDGSTFTTDATTQNATHTYLDDGSYTVALRVTDDEGLSSPINSTVVVVRNLPPTGNVFTPGTSNEGDLVPFTATVEDPSPLDTITVRWDFTYNGQTFKEMANGTRVNHTYLDNGMFDVMMRLTDEDGGMTNVTLSVQVRNVAPIADFVTSAPADEGDVVDLNATVVDPGLQDIHTFEWDFDYDGMTFDPTATRQNVSTQYTQDGNYTVALKVRDDDGGEDLVTHQVTINNLAPKAELDPVEAHDEGEPVKFLGNQTDRGRQDTFTYLWDFDDGSSSTERNPVHVFLDDGVYNVTLVVTDDAGDSGTNWTRVTINNVAPNATIAISPDHITENGTVYFQAEGHDPSPPDEANLTYTWNFGDGSNSNEREVDHRYMDDGCYTVTLTVKDDDGGVRTYTHYVVVDNAPPSVEAQADREYIEEGGTVSFTAAIDDPGPMDTHTVQWDFDDGSSSDLLEVQHRFLDDGNYIVVLTVTDNSGGTNTTTFRVAVSNVRPAIAAEASSLEIAEGGSVSFNVSWTDPGELDEHTVLWDFGDGTNTTELEPEHAYPQDGKYTVLVTVTDDDGGQASKPFIITVSNVPPTPYINVSAREIEEGGVITLTASHTDPGPLDSVTYYWDLGDGKTSNQVKIEDYMYVDNDKYRVTLRADDGDGGLMPPAVVTITVNNVPPEVTATVDLTETTVGKGVTFAASATDVSPTDNVTFKWNFGDFTSSELPEVTHVYTAAGEYDVVLIATDDDGGQRVWETTIVVKPDLDGDGIADEDDNDIDGDGAENDEDDYPRDPNRHTDWTGYVLVLLLIVVVVAAVAAYVMRPKG